MGLGQRSGGTKRGAHVLSFLTVAGIFLFIFFSGVFGATLDVNTNEANLNSIVRISGYGFTPNSTVTLENNLEPNSAWWDGYNEQWGFPVLVATNASGDFNYDYNVLYDFRTSPGKQYFKVGDKIASTMHWLGGGAYTASANGVVCSGTKCFTASTVVGGIGGIQKFDIDTGNRDCNVIVAVNGNDIATDGTYLYTVWDGTSNNLRRTLAADCSGTTAFTTAAQSASSIKLDSSNTYAFITYALANTPPRKYQDLTTTPANVAAFAPANHNSVQRDICISPDSNRVYVGYDDGNVDAYDFVTGAKYWSSDPDDTNATLAVLGLDCDANNVYVAKGLNNSAVGPFFGGQAMALSASNGALVWRSERIDNQYVYGQYNNIRCDSVYCYAVIQAPVLGGAGVANAPIIQIRKTDGKIGWWNWRSWTASTGAYGAGSAPASPQNLYVDSDVNNGFIYPVYSNGRIQKIAKNDVNVQTFYDTNLWIKANTNLYNFVMNPTKNVFFSNELPSFTFKAMDNNGNYLSMDDNRFYTSYLRFSTITAFDEYTATENASSQFIDPRIMTATSTSVTAQPNPTPYNYARFFYNENIDADGGAAPGHCSTTIYRNPAIYGWHTLARACLYENIDLNNPFLLHTANGVFLSATEFALVAPKRWENYPLTKLFGADNWAWLSDHNAQFNQVFGFLTRFGRDQNEVWTDNLGRATRFINTAAATSYIYDYVDATLDFNNPNERLQVWHENYFLFKPKGNGLDGNRHWQYVEDDTNMIANPMTVVQGTNTSGSYTIGGNTYSNLVEFTATEPGVLARTNEPFWFDVNFTGAIRSDCADLVVTDTSDTPIGLWQLDANTCSANRYYTLFVQDNFTFGEAKNYRLYYNSPAAQVTAGGTTDLAIQNLTGSCTAGTDSLDINSNNYFSWFKPGVGGATEQLRFKFGENQTSTLWNHATTRYQMNVCFKNSQTANTGAGAVADNCGTALALFASRCYQRSYNNNKIFVRMDMNSANFTVTPHLGTAQTRKIMTKWYFFNNTGRVRVMSKLDNNLATPTTGISRDYHPYYFFGTYSLVPQGTVGDDFLNWGGRKELMDSYVPFALTDQNKTAIIKPSPLPLQFTLDYNFEHLVNVPDALTKTGNGCTVHKVWPYFSWRPLGATNATGATTFATAYTTDFISCDSDLNTSIPSVGTDGYVNAFPKESIYGTGLNKFVDPNAVAKFYLKPNLFIPDNRENRWLPPLALNAQYGTSAKVSTYVLDVCPTKDYGYKGFDDFLLDVPNLISSSSTHMVTTNRTHIPCATSLVKFSTNTGSIGAYYLFQKDVNVFFGNVVKPDAPYPSNLYNAQGGLSVNGSLDYTFAQKSAYFYGNWIFTSSSDPYVIHAYSTTGAEQLSGQTRYAWAPSFAYNKKVFDESGFWNESDSNLSYLMSPCNWNIGSNPFGDMDLGPGWVKNFGTTTQGTICPKTNENIENYTTFRPSRNSLYPAAATAAVWEELVIDGRPNKPTALADLGIDAALYSRHNSLWDYEHFSDYQQVIDSAEELNEGKKHQNDQPWVCDISRKENESFCMVPMTTTTLIYTYSPGALTVAQPWSAYYQSDREYSTMRSYLYNRWFDTGAYNPTYDFLTERTVLPMLSQSEVTYDILYTSNNADDYNTLFRKVFPRLHNALYQTQFLLTDWKNNAFMTFSDDTREYLRGQTIDVNGFVLKNSENLSNAPIIVQVYKNSEPTIPLTTYQTITDAEGDFNYSYTVPPTATAGLYFMKVSYNNDDVNGVATFKVSSLGIDVTYSKTAYVGGDPVSVNAFVNDSITGDVITNAALTFTLTGPSGNILINTQPMTNAGFGNYTYDFVLDANTNEGVYVVQISATTSSSTGTSTTAFGVSSEVGEIQITNPFRTADANTTTITQLTTLTNLTAAAVSNYYLTYQVSGGIDFNKVTSVTLDGVVLTKAQTYATVDSSKYYLMYDEFDRPIIALRQDFNPSQTKSVSITAQNDYYNEMNTIIANSRAIKNETAIYCSVLTSSDAVTICENANNRFIDLNANYATTQTLTKAGQFFSTLIVMRDLYQYYLDEHEIIQGIYQNKSTCQIFLPSTWKLDSNVSAAVIMNGPGGIPLSGLDINAKLYDSVFNLTNTYALDEFGSGWYYKTFAAPQTSQGYLLMIDQNIGTNSFKCSASFDVNQLSVTVTGVGIGGGGLTTDQNATLYQILALSQDINANTNTILTLVNGINSTVNTINSNLTTVQSSLVDINSRIIDIDSNVIYIKNNSGASVDLTDLNAKLDSLILYAIDINSTTHDSNDAIASLALSVDGITSSLSSIQSAVLDINNTLSACTLTPTLSICGKLDTLIANLGDLNTTLYTVKATTETIQTTTNTTNGTVNTIEGAVNSISATVNDINSTANFIKDKVTLIDANVVTARNEITTVNNLLTCASQPANSVCDKLATLSTLLNDVNISIMGGLAGISTQIGDINFTSGTTDVNLDAVLAELNCTTPAGNDICSRLILIQGYTDSIETGITDLNNTVLAISANVIDLNTQASETHLAVIDVNTNLQTVQSGILTANSEITLTQNMISDVNARIIDVNNTIHGIVNTINNTLLPTLTQINLNTNTLLTHSNAIDGNLALIQSMITDVNAAVNSISVIVGNINGTVNTIDSKVDILQTGISDINTIVRSVDANVQIIRNNMATAQNITDLNTNLQSVLIYSQDINLTAHATNTTVNEVLSALSDINATTQTIRTLAVDINAIITTCSIAPTNSVCDKLNSLSTGISNLSNTLSALNATTLDINSVVYSTNATVNSTNATVNTINGTVNDINTTANFINNKIIGMDANISSALSEIAIVKTLLNCTATPPAGSVCDKLTTLGANVLDINTSTTLSLTSLISKVDAIDGKNVLIDANLQLVLNQLLCTSPGVSDVCARLIRVEGYTDSIENSISDLNNITNTIQNTVIDINSTNYINQTIIRDVNSAIQTANTGIVNANSAITSTQNMLVDVNSRIVTLQTTLSDINAFLNTINNNILSVGGQLTTIDGKVDALSVQISDVNTRIVNIAQQTTNIAANMATAQSISLLDANIQLLLGITNDINAATSDSNTATALLAVSVLDINTQLQMVHTLASDINSIINTCSIAPTNSICSRLSLVDSQLSLLSGTLSTLGTTITDINFTTTQTQQTVGAINTTMNDINSTLYANTQTLASLGAQISLLDNNFAQIILAIENVREVADCNNFPDANICAKIDLLNQHLIDVNFATTNTLAGIDDKINATSTALSLVDANVAQILLELDCVAPANADVCSRLIDLNTTAQNTILSITDVNSQLVQIMPTLSDINSRVTSNNSQITALALDINSVLLDTNSLKTDTNSLAISLVAMDATLANITALATDTNNTTHDINTVVQQTNNTVNQISSGVSGISSTVSDINTTVRDLNTAQQQLIQQVTSMQNVLSDVNDTVNNIRSDAQNKFSVVLSDFGVITPGSVYRAKLWVYDSNGALRNADAIPKITLYDPSRNAIVENIDMNFSETGIYTYSFTTGAGQIAGQWEAIASATVNGSTVKPSDFWELTGNPPEVRINSITDTSIPTITADVLITNEGLSSQEYQYEYCIVTDQTNQCGGGDDIDYQSGAKLISPSISWNTLLTLNAPSAGVYWFKVKVYYGTERSAASKQFVATTDNNSGTVTGGGNTGGGGSSGGGLFGLPMVGKGKLHIDDYPQEIVVTPGEPTFAAIKITNIGDAPLHNSKALIEGIPSEWYTVQNGRKELAPSDTTNILIKILPPKDAPAKDWLAKIKVIADEETLSVDTIVRIIESPLKEIIFSNIETQKLYVGEESSATITLTNPGQKELVLNVSLLAPKDWELLENERTITLLPGETQTVKFNYQASERYGVQSLVIVVTKADGTKFASNGEDRLLKEFLVVARRHSDDEVTADFATPLNIPAQLTDIILVLVVIGLLFTLILIERHAVMEKINELRSPGFSKKEVLLSRIDYRLARIEEKLSTIDEKSMLRKEGLARRTYSPPRENKVNPSNPRWGANRRNESDAEIIRGKPKKPIFGRKGESGKLYFD